MIDEGISIENSLSTNKHVNKGLNKKLTGIRELDRPLQLPDLSNTGKEDRKQSFSDFIGTAKDID